MKTLEEIYAGYAEIPYVSKERDLQDWINNPEKYPYKKVEKSQMIRLKEGILPGDLILLWRIGFNNFTTESIFPEYFEYRYGVDASKSIELLQQLGMIRLGTAIETLDVISVPVLKKILEGNNLKKSGNRAELLERVLENVSEGDIGTYFTQRRYVIEDKGRKVLLDNDGIIQKHGPKQ